jgi:hypothetical protein
VVAIKELLGAVLYVKFVVVGVVVFVSDIQVCNCLMGWGGMNWIYLA